jgi:hypothetical protein
METTKSLLAMGIEHENFKFGVSGCLKDCILHPLPDVWHRMIWPEATNP